LPPILVFLVWLCVSVPTGVALRPSTSTLATGISLTKRGRITTVKDVAGCLSGIHPDVMTYATAGAVSGASRAVARFLSYPLDTLKTVAQAESLDKDEREIQRLAADVAPRSFADLFRGVVLAVVSAVPANSIFIVVFNTLDAYLPCVDPDHTLSVPVAHLIISTLATIPQNVFKIPAELLKQRAQLSDNQDAAGRAASFSSIFSDVKRLGLTGLYQGGDAMMLREVPFNALQMALFYSLKDAASSSQFLLSAQPSPAQLSGLLGLVSAGLAALATQPADTIKTRLMKIDGKDDSIFSMSRKIYAASGLAGFFVGTTSRVLLVSIGGLIYFLTLTLTGGER